MDTIVEHVDKDGGDKSKAAFEKAGEILRNGGLVAFPTETVYGLGGDALKPYAAKKIYEAKGRPSDNPLIVHIADRDAVYKLAKGVTEEAERLMDAFWPGPMTLIFKKRDIVPKETTGGLDTVAIRFPSHFAARALISTSGLYIAAPSANLSGRPSPTKVQHVIGDLSGRIDMILDGGDVELGLESTIIDMSADEPVILRPGYITEEMLCGVLKHISTDAAILEEKVNDNLVARAPGMKYRHYAPKGQLTIVEGDSGENVIAAINSLAEESAKQGKKVAVIATEESREKYKAPTVVTIGSRHDELSVAQHLFDILRQMDDIGADVIYCESFGRKQLGRAIMNRLLKAAGYHVLKV